jgi:hypothetical protein
MDTNRKHPVTACKCEHQALKGKCVFLGSVAHGLDSTDAKEALNSTSIKIDKRRVGQNYMFLTECHFFLINVELQRDMTRSYHSR